MNKKEISIKLIDDLIDAGDDLANLIENSEGYEANCLHSWDEAVDAIKKEMEGLEG